MGYTLTQVKISRASLWQRCCGRVPPCLQSQMSSQSFRTLFFFLLVAIVVWLSVHFSQPRELPPPILTIGLHNTTTEKPRIDIAVAMNIQGWVDYLLLSNSSLDGNKLGLVNAIDISWSNLLWGGSHLQVH